MRHIVLLFLIIIILPSYSFSGEKNGDDIDHFEENQIYDTKSTLDSNIAFYEGRESSYLISPPVGFELEIQRAKMDGYSMSFIPLNSSFDSAGVRIDVSILNHSFKKKRKLLLNDFISEDSTSLIEHFGKNLEFYKIDSILNNSNEKLVTYYINDKSQFIPNVMVAYYFKKSELFIFELSISESYPRFEAEKQFIELINNFKILSKKEISSKN